MYQLHGSYGYRKFIQNFLRSSLKLTCKHPLIRVFMVHILSQKRTAGFWFPRTTGFRVQKFGSVYQHLPRGYQMVSKNRVNSPSFEGAVSGAGSKIPDTPKNNPIPKMQETHTPENKTYGTPQKNGDFGWFWSKCFSISNNPKNHWTLL